MGNFCPPGSESGSGFRIRIRMHWPDWIRIQLGSGSATRVTAILLQFVRKRRHCSVLRYPVLKLGSWSCTCRSSSPWSWSPSPASPSTPLSAALVIYRLFSLPVSYVSLKIRQVRLIDCYTMAGHLGKEMKIKLTMSPYNNRIRWSEQWEFVVESH